jgi:hypothetical protein
LDTGAQVSTISEHFYKKYLSTSKLSDTKILRLSAANKLQIPYLGYIEVNLKIRDTMYTNVGMLVECATNSSDSIQVVLGCNILQSARKQSKQAPSLLEDNAVWNNVISALDLNEENKQIGFVCSHVIVKQTLQFHVFTNVAKVYRLFSFLHNAT